MRPIKLRDKISHAACANIAKMFVGWYAGDRRTKGGPSGDQEYRIEGKSKKVKYTLKMGLGPRYRRVRMVNLETK